MEQVIKWGAWGHCETVCQGALFAKSLCMFPGHLFFLNQSFCGVSVIFLFGDVNSAMNNIKLSVLMFALVTDRIKYNLHSLISFWALRDYDLAVMLHSSKINSKWSLKANIFSSSAVWWLPTEVMRGLENTTVAGTTCKPNIVYICARSAVRGGFWE